MSVRFACEGDIPAMLDIYGPYVETTCYSFEYVTPSVADFTQRFRNYTAQFPWLVWEEQGIVLGYAYGSAPFTRAAYSWCAEVSVYLHPKIQGKGIGSLLYKVLETLLFRQGYEVIYSLITTDNAPSIAFHQKLGYRQVALLPDCGIKHGKRLGIVYMEKRQDIVELPKKAPASIGDIVKDDSILPNILGSFSIS